MQYLIATTKAISISKLIDPQYREQIKRSWDSRVADNAVKYNDAVKAWIQTCDNVVAIYGRNSAVHKYILSHKVPKPPNITAEWEKLMKQFRTWERKEAKRLEKEAMIAVVRAKARDYRSRRNEAVEMLEENGFVQGEDFGRSHAITYKKKVLVTLPTGTTVKREWPERIEVKEYDDDRR